MQYTLGELKNYLCERGLAVELRGDAEVLVEGLATIQTAGPLQLSFLANPNYRKYLATTGAAAIILHPNEVENCQLPALVFSNPYIAFAHLTEKFKSVTPVQVGIHPQACVDESAEVAADAYIGPGCVIEAGANIGAAVMLQANVFVGRDCRIAAETKIHSNTSICAGVSIGRECIIHNNVVIGSDGFGFAPTADGWLKVHQLGGVIIGDRVEIGSSTTIDRGALDNTVISDGVKIDNQVQIAHNVRVGQDTAIAACAGIAGSSTVGRGCTIAGGVGVVGHIEICDGVHITGMTMVTKSITEAGSYSSGTPMMSSKKWKRAAVRFSQLDDMSSRLRKLEP